ncbi:pyrroloquinoline quinone biosynthesis protein PqqB [Pseudarthrobacter sp. J47]|uniref:pyrroloquinoline quinone biosynthesis protein PqqB n=2 Tax=Pseudarthrobacter sp. J47 TaxID=3116482 RepID=UPI002E8075D5|nr:pyrroloquinoline quinone biosynthesis protein PqqB [Pseudarthrobacter sp. J47]MEE2523819.1 pyrroloquinoline quinone biosynthesis protein PqqB [Pseudarthrobacter sp. J47]
MSTTMFTRVLGSAAGGGFPQWNCACPQCRAARSGSRPCVPRSQSSIAVSADRKEWFLFNASPDIQSQIEAFDDLHPDDGSVTRMQSVMLTDAELDHTLGLLLMREGRGLEVHATESVYETLSTGTGVLRTLEAYCPVTWKPVVPGDEVMLGEGLSYRAFDVPTTKRMRFAGAAENGRVVGYTITDTSSGQRLVYLPCVQELTPGILAELAGASALLIDGTCWSDDEMPSLGLASKTSRDMGHVPITGPGGSLELLSPLPIERKIYIHINNTNPILLDDSPERLHLDRHDIGVAVDGLELEI